MQPLASSPRPRPPSPDRARSGAGARRWIVAIVACALVVAAVPFLALPIDDMLVGGLFSWHLARPQTVQGGLEAMLLLASCGGLLLAAGRWPRLLAVVALPLALYLRRHHVDVPAVAGWVLIETLLAGGAALERALRVDTEGEDRLRDLRWFLGGVSSWCLGALAASAVGLGSPSALRGYTAGFAVVAFAVARRPPLVFRLGRGLAGRPTAVRLGTGLLLATFAVLMARTNVTHYHDSLWYGLRGELVLAADGSFFRGLGLVNQVHYYPKLFEVLCLPLSGLGDFSFVMAPNVAAWALLVLVLYRLARELGGDREGAVLAAAVAATLPAAMNIPLTTKPDLFATLLLTLAVVFFWRFLRDGRRWEAAYGVAGVALACATKITSIPYGGLLVAAVAGEAWRRRGHRLAPPRRAAVAATVTAVAACLAAFGFTLRTYLLAGVPTIVPSQFVRLWEAIGFSIRDPVAVMVRHRAKDLAEVPSIAWDFLFAPTSLPLVRITWTGNAWAYLLLAALLLRPLSSIASRNSRRPLWIFAPVVAAGLLFALLFNNTQRGGDGNYYMLPLLVAALLACDAAWRRAGPLRPLLAWLLVPFVLFQLLVGFLTAAWAPGTRTFDLRLDRSVFDTRQTRAEKLAGRGLSEIAAVLEGGPGVARVVGAGDEDVMRWLPARYESLSVIAEAEDDPTESPAAFARYASRYRIDFLLLPRCGLGPGLAAVEAMVEAGAPEVVARSPLFVLLDLRSVRDRLVERAASVEVPARRQHVDLVARLHEAELEGQRPIQAPWGWAIAAGDTPIERYTGRPTMIQLHDTAVTWEIELPAEPGLELRSRVGLLPEFELQAASDGAEVELLVEGAAGEARSRVVEVRPGSGYPSLEIPLDGLEGQRVRVRTSVRPGVTSHQDWLIWIGPRVESPRPPEPSVPPAAGPPTRPAPAPPARSG